MGVSTALDLDRAVEEATAAALDGLGSFAAASPTAAAPSALIVVGTAHGALTADVPRRAGRILGPAFALAGLHVEGVLAERCELMAAPVVAVLCQRGFGGRAYTFDHVRGHEAELGEQIEAELGPIGERDLLLIASDAHELDPIELASGLGGCAPAALVGLGVEGPRALPASHFAGGEVVSSGVLVQRFEAAEEVVVRRAAGLRPLPERTVTRARGHWLHTIEGQPALDAFRAAAGALLGGDLQRASKSIFALAGPRGSLLADEISARAIVGFDEPQGSIALSRPVENGDRFAFAIRDPLEARTALSEVCSALEADSLTRAGIGEPGDFVDSAQLGLAITCRTRGEALFGEHGLESGYLSRGFRGAPWLGLVGSYQLSSRTPAPQPPDDLEHHSRTPQLLHLSGVLARLA